jgi:hypothetical protein
MLQSMAIPGCNRMLAHRGGQSRGGGTPTDLMSVMLDLGEAGRYQRA